MVLSIIIVNYKSKDKTLACLDSIKKGEMAGLVYEIIVVDNASGEDMGEIKNKYSDVILVKSEKNLGMGGGNNLGVKKASGEFILILNPDTIVSEDAIKTLYNFIKSDEAIGIVGPKLLNTDGTLQYSCMRFPKFYTPLLRRTFLGRWGKQHLDDFLMVNFDHNSIKEVDWMMGSCLMIRKSILEKIGFGFDESFFMYFEDTDLCRRAKKAGFKVIYNPQAVAIHDHARQSASHPWYTAPFVEKLAREHIKSWVKYFLK